MKIKTARHIGYCFGVRRAMDLAFNCLESRKGPIYSHGPMIHNRRAMKILQDRGLKEWPDSPAQSQTGATVIIRAHGLSPTAEQSLRAKGVDVVDATCPRVADVQRLVASEAAKGSDIIIWGTAGHPEVEGLLGYAQDRGLVIAGARDVEKLPDLGRVVLVAQTTQNLDLWAETAQAVTCRWPTAKCLNTVCQATVNRQSEARRLAEECQGLVVVGDRHSSNTRKLFEIGQAKGLKTISVEGAEEIEPGFIEDVDTVGLIAGASTPVWQIRLVYQKLLSLGRSQENNIPAFLRRFSRAIVLSNIYLGLGSCCLGWSIGKVVGCQIPDFLFGLFFFFTQAMHMLHGYLDLNSARYNDLDRLDFLTKYKPYLFCLGLSSLLLSLSAAYLAGPWVLTLIVILSVCGLFYAIPLPVSPLGRWGVRRLKDIPLSKAFCTAVGWASLLVIPLLLSRPPIIKPDLPGLKVSLLAFLAVFFQVLCRSIRMDFQASLGDRIFGRRTAVTFLGWKGAIKLLWISNFVWGVYLVFLWLVWPHSPIIFLLISGPLLNLLLWPGFISKDALAGFLLDLVLDSQFLLAALTVWIWTQI
ncbi:MAG: 4-hydroxy-3-methylbut-2-enyl diphosphate reductase [Deltaproteobacteria bacterium]|jgi:4-hydroxy-3-methylbut-2-enyl diphosphate reductase|nr:4-hydroxy-3-methylbut-2-enyl diphosphate reductase [Deltaproteobacteria bacterium]